MRFMVLLHARGVSRAEGKDGETVGVMTMRTVTANSPEEAVQVASLVLRKELIGRFGANSVQRLAIRPREILRISWYRWWQLNLPYVFLEDDPPWTE